MREHRSHEKSVKEVFLVKFKLVKWFWSYPKSVKAVLLLTSKLANCLKLNWTLVNEVLLETCNSKFNKTRLWHLKYIGHKKSA